MARKKTSAERPGAKKAKQKANKMPAQTGRAKSRRKPRWAGAVVATLLLATLSYAGVASYQHHYEQQTDLSVIGNGSATVVQVHDPACALCRQLKDNTMDALKRMDNDIQYRIADLTSAKGRSFAATHQSKKVTLVTFTRDGKLHNKFTGVRSVDTLEVLMKELVRR